MKWLAWMIFVDLLVSSILVFGLGNFYC